MLAILTDTLVFAQAETGSSDEEGSFLVSPSVGLMVWTLFLFGVSMFILWKLAFPRIAEALDRRQKAIEESIDLAERTRREADELLAVYRERLTAARQQADDIVARARKAGEQAEADLVVKGRERREELLEQARRDI
jgi:F-type H+-transporting ATPase subunit b